MSDETRNLMDRMSELSAEVPDEEWRALAKARMRERLDKDPVATRAFLDDLFSSSKLQGHLDRKTDAEVGDLVSKLEEAFDLTALSPFSALIQNAAERLRRANGGKTYDTRMGDLEEALTNARKTFKDLEKRVLLQVSGHGTFCACGGQAPLCIACEASAAAKAIDGVLKG